MVAKLMAVNGKYHTQGQTPQMDALLFSMQNHKPVSNVTLNLKRAFEIHFQSEIYL